VLVIRVVILYFLVMIGLRIMGKREIGQLSVFDFVVSIMIAEVSTLGMEDGWDGVLQSGITIVTLVILQLIVAFVTLKSHRLRSLVDGEPSILVEHGEIKDKELRKSRYAVSDLLMQLREKGFANVADVEFAILETSGKLSVIPKAEKRPLTPADIGQQVKPETIEMPLIEDSKPVEKTLRILARDESWLRGEIQRLGYQDYSDVFYASIDADGAIHINPVEKAKDAKKNP
jgi:uncharacterized membrane protein YcaP (DUF421 family)